MSRLRALMIYQFKLQIREYLNIFFIVAFPVLMYLFFSNMLEGELFYDGSFDAVYFLLPAYIPIVITNTIVLVFGQMLVSHKEHNFFIKYKLMGYKPVQVAGTLFVAVLIFQFIGIMALIVTAVITTGVTLPYNNLINVIIIILIINIFQFALAFFLSSVFNKSSIYQSVALIVFYIQMFLGGMALPPEMFPERIKTLAEIFNPIIHGLYVMRGVWISGKSIFEFPMEIILLLGVSIVLFLLGTKMFKWYDLQS
ncbi:ABC-2 type transport system permease protein [Natranaerovirga pectinivora]|uniref:ABC-2 type transport system permease protein n=1 Tax=Natranaerovirga pectinivora TaxID=682400 RepID=A0A4R3MMB7_9FIRM|nr:ABC transporter permease [Natranaerovirga pectinivora]TCT15395.1 ABC-2 type transport system permease protein [Natranaerovirga pectinivora]